MSREIKRIIIHASATPPDMDIGVEEIRRWHVEERGWSDIAYHMVIRRNGTVESGRPIERAGAHAKGNNHDSIGICMVGGVKGHYRKPDANFTLVQYRALSDLVASLIEIHGGLSMHGHRDFSKKACPCFDVKSLVVEDANS